MNKIILISIVLISGWYGNILYKENKLPFLQNTKNLGLKIKCVTKDGRVLYGTVPAGTVCERHESVEGLIMIIPSKATNSNKGKSSNVSTSKYICDSRTYCSQMTSRAQAEYFNQYCPNTRMDGDNDGIPCENDSRF